MNQRLLSGTVRVVAFAAALLLLTVLVVTRSQAAFTSTTSNPTSGFDSGTVGLVDDDSGTALFTATGMKPNTPLVQCIQVTYNGTLTPAPVKLYASASGALAPYLDLTIEAGTGGGFNNCGPLSGATTIYSGTLSDFAASHTGWGNGLSAFSAGANPDARTFRFTVTVQDTNAAQGLHADAGFTWETQV